MSNKIDNAIDEVRDSKYVQKTATSVKIGLLTVIKWMVTIGIIGGIIFIIGIMAGIIK